MSITNYYFVKILEIGKSFNYSLQKNHNKIEILTVQYVQFALDEKMDKYYYSVSKLIYFIQYDQQNLPAFSQSHLSTTHQTVFPNNLEAAGLYLHQ